MSLFRSDSSARQQKPVIVCWHLRERERENLIFTIKPDVTDIFSSLNNSVNSTKLYLQTRMYRIISCDIRMNDFSFRFKIKTFFCDPLVFFVSKSPKSKCDHAFFWNTSRVWVLSEKVNLHSLHFLAASFFFAVLIHWVMINETRAVLGEMKNRVWHTYIHALMAKCHHEDKFFIFIKFIWKNVIACYGIYYKNCYSRPRKI